MTMTPNFILNAGKIVEHVVNGSKITYVTADDQTVHGHLRGFLVRDGDIDTWTLRVTTRSGWETALSFVEAVDLMQTGRLTFRWVD